MVALFGQNIFLCNRGLSTEDLLSTEYFQYEYACPSDNVQRECQLKKLTKAHKTEDLVGMLLSYGSTPDLACNNASL